MPELEAVYGELLAVLKRQDVNTALAEYTASAGEYEPALFDLCYAASQGTPVIPDTLADTVTAWLDNYDLIGSEDRATLTDAINQRRASASPT